MLFHLSSSTRSKYMYMFLFNMRSKNDNLIFVSPHVQVKILSQDNKYIRSNNPMMNILNEVDPKLGNDFPLTTLDTTQDYITLAPVTLR